MVKIKLTKFAVDAAKPQAQPIELRDTLVPGFLCKITPAGRKVFMLQYRTNAGERRKPALGMYGELTVEQARSLALRNRELSATAQGIVAETGLEHHPVGDGERVSGVYRRSVMLASGRFAMLDDGKGFALVPWKPVLEQRLGQSMTAVVRGSNVTWTFGRQRGV